MSESRVPRPKVLPDLLIDLVMVFAFVLIGRRTHDGTFDPAGTWHATWPFFAALLVGWIVARAWRSPDKVWPTGVIIWLVTVAGGMLFRMLSGQGTDIAFVLVATLTLGTVLIGWRLLGVWIERILAKRTANKEAAEQAAIVNAAAQADAKAQAQAARNRPDPNRRTPGM